MYAPVLSNSLSEESKQQIFERIDMTRRRRFVAPDRFRTRVSSGLRVILVFMIGLACLLR